MQRITNCILRDQNKKQVLLLQKPRRGWWVAPGGKMEKQETIIQSVTREFEEETGYRLINPTLRGVFTIIVEDNGEIQEEWMMFTFLAEQYEGELLTVSPEGKLEWKDMNAIASLPKAKGDQLFFEHILNHDELLVMKFRYTKEYELIAYE